MIGIPELKIESRWLKFVWEINDKYIYIYPFVQEATCKNCVEQGCKIIDKIKQCFKVSKIGFWSK